MTARLCTIAGAALHLLACAPAGQPPQRAGDDARLDSGFAAPQRVTIRGYDGDAMEPQPTLDGRYLLFNNRNDPSINTDLFVARRVDDLT